MDSSPNTYMALPEIAGPRPEAISLLVLPRRVGERPGTIGLHGVVLLLALGGISVGPTAAGGESPRDPMLIYFNNTRAFRIPFNIEPEDRARIKEVRLCVSEDQGKTWSFVSQAAPEQGALTFRAPKDGEYWFAVQTLDTEGRFNPPTIEVLEPNLKVIVDHERPKLGLESGGRRGGVASVRWAISDDRALDGETLRLEYSAGGSTAWHQIPVPRPVAQTGTAYWDPGTDGPIHVRATVADRARNVGEILLDLPGVAPEDDVCPTPLGRGQANPIASKVSPPPIWVDSPGLTSPERRSPIPWRIYFPIGGAYLVGTLVMSLRAWGYLGGRGATEEA
jgi:hypothetical protein